jgi:hypothetical protein
MALLLILNVPHHRVAPRLADAEGTVTGLPGKFGGKPGTNEMIPLGLKIARRQ